MIPEISVASIVTISISVFIAILAPIVLMVVLYMRTHVKMINFFLGAAVCVLFTGLFSGGINHYLLEQNQQTAAFIQSVPAVAALYSCLSAGIIQESGRMAAFSLSQKQDLSLGAAAAFGLGYITIDSMFFSSSGIIANLSVAVTLKTQGAQSMIDALPKSEQDAFSQSLLELVNTPALSFLSMGVERLTAMALQVSLSILIWMVALKLIRLYFFPISIALHALYLLPSILYGQGVLTNVWLVQGIVVFYTAALCCLVYFLYQKNKHKPMQLHDRLPARHL